MDIHVRADICLILYFIVTNSFNAKSNGAVGLPMYDFLIVLNDNMSTEEPNSSFVQDTRHHEKAPKYETRI